MSKNNQWHIHKRVYLINFPTAQSITIIELMIKKKMFGRQANIVKKTMILRRDDTILKMFISSVIKKRIMPLHPHETTNRIEKTDTKTP